PYTTLFRSQHHERHHDVHQRDDDTGHGEHHADGFIGDADGHHHVVDEAIGTQQNRPAQRAHGHRDEQRSQNDEQEDATPAAPHARQDQGFGYADHDAHEGHDGGHAGRAREDLEVIGVGEDLDVVGEGVGVENAPLPVEGVQR